MTERLDQEIKDRMAAEAEADQLRAQLEAMRSTLDMAPDVGTFDNLAEANHAVLTLEAIRIRQINEITKSHAELNDALERAGKAERHPTVWAYEQACRALQRLQAQNKRLREALASCEAPYFCPSCDARLGPQSHAKDCLLRAALGEQEP